MYQYTICTKYHNTTTHRPHSLSTVQLKTLAHQFTLSLDKFLCNSHGMKINTSILHNVILYSYRGNGTSMLAFTHIVNVNSLLEMTLGVRGCALVTETSNILMRMSQQSNFSPKPRQAHIASQLQASATVGLGRSLSENVFSEEQSDS